MFSRSREIFTRFSQPYTGATRRRLPKSVCRRVGFAWLLTGVLMTSIDSGLAWRWPSPAPARSALALQPAPLGDAPVSPRPFFAENIGQWDERVRFELPGARGSARFAANAIWFTLLEPSDDSPLAGTSGVRLRLSFVGANPSPTLEGSERLPVVVSSYLGNDPARWRTGVPAWRGLRYVELYPGIDLEITVRDERWSWRFVFRHPPSKAVPAVRLRVEGADRLAIEGDHLRIGTPLGNFWLPLLEVTAPQALGLSGIRQAPLVKGNEIEAPFQRPGERPDPSVLTAPVPLDPQAAPLAVPPRDVRPLLFSMLLGSPGNDRTFGLAVDPVSQAVFLTGRTEQAGFTGTTGGFSGGSNDVFVTKLNSDGSLAFSSYLGGERDDQGFDIALAPDGSGLYLTGRTDSPDFPTEGAFASSLKNDLYDTFVTKLDPEGAVTYSTYLGGSEVDYGYAVAPHPGKPGLVYVTGMTASSDFPVTSNALDQVFAGGQEAFLVAFDTNRRGLGSRRYATFLGGSAADQGHDLELDPSGENIYVVGQTESADFFQSFPVPVHARAFSKAHGGSWDAFLVKLGEGNFQVSYVTFLGGSGMDCEVPGDFRECRVAVSSSRLVYIAGMTSSSNFPTTPGAYSRVHRGGSLFGHEVFAVKVDTLAQGRQSLVYSTFLGGRADDFAFGLAVDDREQAYVVGRTESCDFPVSPRGFRSLFHGADEGFLAKFSPSGRLLLYSSFFGGSDVDSVVNVALDRERVVYVAGRTSSPNFPGTEAPSELSGASDAFIASFDVPLGLAETSFQLNDRGVSHLHWPFEESTFDSPCSVQAPDERDEQHPFLCWGQVSPVSGCHRSDDLYAQDWVLCDYERPNCTRSEAGDTAAGKLFLSPVDGKVVFAGSPAHLFGSQVIVQAYVNAQPTPYALRVGHFQDGSFAVEKGNMVARGDPLGRVGRTGESAGGFDHAHVALYKNLDDAALEKLKQGNVLEGPLCGGKLTSNYAAQYVLDAYRSSYPVEYLFDSNCDFDQGLVRNSGAYFTSLPQGRIRGPAEDFREFARLVPRGSNKALELDDVVYVEVDHSENLLFTGGVGVEAFIWRESNADEDPIIGKWADDEQWLLTFLPEGNGKLVFTVRLASGQYASVEHELPSLDYLRRWVQVAATYSPNEGLRLYWDGEEVLDPSSRTRPVRGAIVRGSSAIRIGDAGANRSRFRGRIDNMRIWWPRLLVGD